MKNQTMSVTNLMLKDIAKTSPLDRKTEHRLFIEYRAATNEKLKARIKKDIISSNMRFVLEVALKYKNIKGINIGELVSEGKLGLLMAFEKFDPHTSNKFISYAVWWIRCKITKYLEQNDLIRLPAHKKIQLTKQIKLMDVKDFDQDTLRLYEITNNHVSITDTNTDGSLSIAETIGDDSEISADKEYQTDILKKKLIDFLSENLKEEEFLVITNLYGIGTENPLPLSDVKYIIGKSHERVRQIRDCALKTLRNQSENIGNLKEILYFIK